MIIKTQINSILAAMHLGPSGYHVPSIWVALSNAGAGEPSAAIGYRRVSLRADDFTWNSSLFRMQNNLPIGFPACTSGEYGDTSSRKVLTIVPSLGGTNPVWQNSQSGWGATENRCTSGTTIVFSTGALRFDLNDQTPGSGFAFGNTFSQSLHAAVIGGSSPFVVKSTYIGILNLMYSPFVNSISELSAPVTSGYERKGVTVWSFNTASFYVTNGQTLHWTIGVSGSAYNSMNAIAMFDTATQGTGNMIWAIKTDPTTLGGAIADDVYINAGDLRITIL